MKKLFIILIITAAHLYSMHLLQDNKNPHYDRLVRMVHVAGDKQLNLSEKKNILGGLIDDAFQSRHYDILDWIPSFHSDFKSFNNVDAILMSGQQTIVKENVPFIGWDEITERRAFYKKKAKKNKLLVVCFFECITDHKELMANFLFNTRYRDAQYPPLMTGDRYHSRKKDFLKHKQLKYLFLDNVIRMQHKLLRTIISIQDPDAFKNAFEEGYLPLHLAVQIDWYDVAKQILKNDSSCISKLDFFNRTPEFYLNRGNIRMKNLLEWHKHLQAERKSR